MTIDQLKQVIQQKMDALKTYVERDLPDAVGVEAVNYYKSSFDNEAWEGNKWPDVKRRDPNSPWYGFEYQAQTGGKKNFKPTRTTAKILHGENEELRKAITYRKKPGKVIVSNEKSYATVHNNGETAKVFGKHSFKMPKRQFIGNSDKLNNNIRDKIQRDVENILKSK